MSDRQQALKTPCPCGQGELFGACCGRFIESDEVPSTAEALMRSRYTAYTLGNIDYIAKTMLSPASDGFDAVDALAWAKSCDWQKLEVIRAQSNMLANTAIVEFIAYYKLGGQAKQLHEVSEFCYQKGHWYYWRGASHH